LRHRIQPADINKGRDGPDLTRRAATAQALPASISLHAVPGISLLDSAIYSGRPPSSSSKESFQGFRSLPARRDQRRGAESIKHRAGKEPEKGRLGLGRRRWEYSTDPCTVHEPSAGDPGEAKAACCRHCRSPDISAAPLPGRCPRETLGPRVARVWGNNVAGRTQMSLSLSPHLTTDTPRCAWSEAMPPTGERRKPPNGEWHTGYNEER
jgi:hypothetical protein